MRSKPYRVIQWMTGDVGQAAIRHFADSPVFELAGVLVHNPDKVGKDAGVIAGIDPVGVVTTDDAESITALDADCVFYTPIVMDVATVCRLLQGGKNVVTTSGFYYPTEKFRAAGEQIRAACRDGGTSFYASGIHPGYAGDLLPLTAARIASRIDRIQLWEVVNVLTDAPLDHIDWMGFGKNKDAFLSEPTLMGMAVPFFEQSMYLLADALGVHIDEVTAEVHVATAATEIPHELGSITPGSIAGQHHEWTAWVDGRPLIVYHAIYVIGSPDQLQPSWNWGLNRPGFDAHLL